jgi:hypothetical protein
VVERQPEKLKVIGSSPILDKILYILIYMYVLISYDAVGYVGLITIDKNQEDNTIINKNGEDNTIIVNYNAFTKIELLKSRCLLIIIFNKLKKKTENKIKKYYIYTC